MKPVGVRDVMEKKQKLVGAFGGRFVDLRDGGLVAPDAPLPIDK